MILAGSGGGRAGGALAPSRAVAIPSPTVAANRFEIALGRTAAACIHPMAAWHTTRRSMRVMLVAGYFGLGFAAALTALAWPF